MEWTALAGGTLAACSLANIFLSNRIRGDMAEVKLSVAEKLVQSERETRAWVEHKVELVETRIEKLPCGKTCHGAGGCGA